MIMTVLKKFEYHPDVVNYFKKLPFYNKYIQKPKIKRLGNINLLSELLFYEKFNVIKTDHAIREYEWVTKLK